MGNLKDAKLAKKKISGSQEFDLTDQDLAYIQLFQKAALDLYNYNRNLVKKYLVIMAADEWGYPLDAELDFEIDPKTKKVKVTYSREP